jgi:hypothetical protein
MFKDSKRKTIELKLGVQLDSVCSSLISSYFDVSLFIVIVRIFNNNTFSTLLISIPTLSFFGSSLC